MSAPTVSVVVVSRERPAALTRCLTGIAQLDYPSFELVVVADAAGCRAAEEWAGPRPLKLVAFDQPNISQARNLGVAGAAGEVVAFIDDDAVPETLWLRHLCAPFETTEVAAAGGYVRGRNGISFQWRARTVDAAGEAAALELRGDAPRVLRPSEGRAIKTEGTNMAVRREVLAELGGFDPAFRFFLDETDLNLRLAREGHATAIVPLAEVHHGYLESAQRSGRRVPRDLYELGASKAVFLRKHLAERQRAGALAAFELEQRQRLLRFLRTGPLGPEEVLRLMRRLKAGIADGARREIRALAPLPRAALGFRPFPAQTNVPSQVLAGRGLAGRRLRLRAAGMARAGQRVSVILLSRTALYHRVRFTSEGYWLQQGGLFGRSGRDQPLFTPWRFWRRVSAEAKRVARQRGLGADAAQTTYFGGNAPQRARLSPNAP